jgi:hypothetical protein
MSGVTRQADAVACLMCVPALHAVPCCGVCCVLLPVCDAYHDSRCLVVFQASVPTTSPCLQTNIG